MSTATAYTLASEAIRSLARENETTKRPDLQRGTIRRFMRLVVAPFRRSA